MDLTTRYCPERRDLEEHSWNLVSRLSVLTDRLMNLIGKDRQQFLATRVMCTSVRQEIAVSKKQLEQHRAAHRC